MKSYAVISSNCAIQILVIVVITAATNVRENNSSRTPALINSTNETLVSKQVTYEVGGTRPQNKEPTIDPPRMGREHVTDKPHLNTLIGPKGLVTPIKSENPSLTMATFNGISRLKPLNSSYELKAGTIKMNHGNITTTKAVSNSSTKETASNSTRHDTATNSTILKTNSNSTLSNTNSTISNTNTTLSTNITKSTTAKPRKPTITEHDDMAIIDKKSDSDSPDMPSINTFEKKTRRADYVVPIVAVILSIPLVAIIFSVLLKRGKDWWQHRNYRRMDYLIEGMYSS